METQTLLVIANLALLGIVVFLLSRRGKTEDSQSMLLLQNQISEITRTIDGRLGESAKLRTGAFSMIVVFCPSPLSETDSCFFGFAA